MRVPLFLPFLTTLAAAQLPPNLITNGSFEVGPNATTVTTVLSPSTVFTGWLVYTGSVDQVREWTAGDGNFSLDMDGFTPGGIRQTVTTIVNDHYELTFLMAGNPDTGSVKTLQASAGDTSQTFTFDSTGHDHQHLGWTRMTLSFVAQSTTTVIDFLSLDAPNSDRGPALDDVILHDLDAGYLETYGSGCTGSNGTPTIVPNLPPRVNQPFSVLLTNLPQNEVGMALVGFDLSTFPNPLQSLSSFGFPDCFLYASPDIVDTIGSTGLFGLYVWGHMIPDNPGLVGLRFTMQFFFHDAAATPAEFSATGAASCGVGH